MIFILDECDPGAEHFSLVFVDSDDFDPQWVERQIGQLCPGSEIIGIADNVRWNDHHGHYRHFHQFAGPWFSMYWVEDEDSWVPSKWWCDLDESLKLKMLERWLLDSAHAWHTELEMLRLGGNGSAQKNHFAEQF